MKLTSIVLSLATLVAATALPAIGQTDPTRVLVRAVAHDAKVIGSNVGGARITIRDAASGEVLASGVQEGSTGDTRAIVVEPRARGATVYDVEGTAGYTAELDLDRPTRVEIAAEGPLETPHAAQRASKTVLVVPGVDVLGEGVILELNGFTVEIESPTEDVASGPTLDVRARVTMLCGCPIEPGGLWDADRLDVVARVVRDGEVVAESPLPFAGETSTFAGAVEAPGTGPAELQVLALDPERANVGMARIAIGE